MHDIRAKVYRGKWYAVWTEGGETKRRALRTEDRNEALRSLEDFKAEMAAPPGATVGEIVEAYLAYKDGRIADIARLKYAWERAKSHYGHLRPDQCTLEVSEAYIRKRGLAGVKDGTILKEINTIRQALNWRKATGAQFEAPRQPPPRDRHLSRAEYVKLLKGTRQPHVKLFIILALTTAARKTAILELTWDRVDFKRNQIVLTVDEEGAQNRKRRAVVTMNETCRKALQQAYDVRSRETERVIEYAGKEVKNIKKGFMLAAERAGLTDVTPHDLRHTAAVWMAERGRPMDEIAQYLGHSDSRVTFRVYARYSPEYLKEAASALEIDEHEEPENDE